MKVKSLDDATPEQWSKAAKEHYKALKKAKKKAAKKGKA